MRGGACYSSADMVTAMDYGLTYCKGCGRAIRFVRTKRGAWMPCESFPVRCVPDERGILLYNEDGTSFRGRIVDSRIKSAPVAYEPHFGRCSNPAASSGGKKRKENPADAELRLKEGRERAEAEYKRVLAAELEKREKEWRERRGSL